MSTLLFSFVLGLPISGAVLSALSRRRRTQEFFALSATGLTFAFALWLGISVFNQGPLSSRNGTLYADALSAYLIMIVSGSAFAAAVYSVGYLHSHIRKRKIRPGQLRLYYSLLNIFIFTMLLVLLSNNLGFLWIGTEATTLATAFLVGFYDDERSLEAAWKYVIICSVGIALALFGVLLTYFSALHVEEIAAAPLNWTALMSAAHKLDPTILRLAFIFVLIGFGTKAGLAPMHTWKPDAYSEAPAPISGLMAGGLVNVALYSLIRFSVLVNKAVGGNFVSGLLELFGLLSIGVAVPFILVQRDYKRLLAYSSVEHVGIITFALGVASPLAQFGAMLHMLNNTLVKLLLFFTAGNVRLAYDSKIIRRVTGAINVIPVSAIFLIAGVFAVTGWPPFGLFISEFTIVSAGFAGGHFTGTILFLVFTTLIFIGFIYYASGMVFGEPAREITTPDANTISLLLLVVLAGTLLLLGVFVPSPLQQLLQKVVTILQGRP